MIIDVGANQGEFILDLARKNPEIRCLAIEPIQELANKLLEIVKHENLLNLDVLVAAIDSKERSARFQITSGEDQGGSSLLEFDTQKMQKNEYWRSRPDLVSSQSMKVDTKTLKTILRTYNQNEQIDFLKIDVQGMDVEAMFSLGRRGLRRVKMGMIEVASISTANLYLGQKFDLRGCLNKLKKYGFNVYAIKPNDPGCNEVNVYFARHGVDPEVLEKRFGLRTNEIYGGKWYWTHPTKAI
jgi:FkbM family methyltransferase